VIDVDFHSATRRQVMRQLHRCVAFLAAFLLVQPLALAWNHTGHMTVALIAYRQLGKSARAEVDAILKKHPAIDAWTNDWAKAKTAAFDDEGAYYFMRAAGWPDDIKPNPKAGGFTKFDPPDPDDKKHGIHDKEHFVDFPYELDGINAPQLNPVTILTALDGYLATVKDKDADDAQRAIALAFVIHLYGDIHQPLHCSTRFNSEFPTGDRGGNSFIIRPHGAGIPLHTFVDDILGASTSPKTIDRIAVSIMKAPNLQRNDLAELSHKQRKTWASEESFEEAKSDIYLDGNLPGISSEHFNKHDPSNIDPTPTGFENSVRELARRRVALAGYRLADEINLDIGGK
jgi:S1/P1 Nuclease